MQLRQRMLGMYQIRFHELIWNWAAVCAGIERINNWCDYLVDSLIDNQLIKETTD